MIVVDFETTGLLNQASEDPDQQPGIVQIGIVKINKLRGRAGEINQLINPEKPVWEPDAIKTHGITPKLVEIAPTLSEFLPTMAEFCLGEDIWIGFNNPFDKRVLWFQLLRYGWSMRFPWPIRDLDVMKLGKDYMTMSGRQDIKPPKLLELYAHLFGMPYAGAHDALRDSNATLDCLWKLEEEGVAFI